MKNLLFISWDGPQTSYMEGLFLPIFFEISKKKTVKFHIIQFTWSTKAKTNATKNKAEALGITYTAYPVIRKPSVIIGSIISLIKGCLFVKKYINSHNIAIVMPRSTMPAVMVNSINLKNRKLIFDADGLPLEERIDFAGLSNNSRQYKWLKAAETKMLIRADIVITRSQRAIDFHIKNIGEAFRYKFGIVFNGRNTDEFKPNLTVRNKVREKLGFGKNERVFVYCGSLGPQYGWKEMIAIVKEYIKLNSNAKFLILTGSPEFANKNLPLELKQIAIVKKVPFTQVPEYLSAADIAFAIRTPKPSMQGVAPIKLGEYLLMGLPTIASEGIGDTETIIKDIPNCYLFQHKNENNIKETIDFINALSAIEKEEIRNYGKQYFSIAKSVESYINVLAKL